MEDYDPCNPPEPLPRFRVPADCVTPGYYLLNAVIRDPELLEAVDARLIRIARDLLPYERPRLAATAIMEAPGFADMLDAAIARSETARHEVKVIPAERQAIEPSRQGCPQSVPIDWPDPYPSLSTILDAAAPLAPNILHDEKQPLPRSAGWASANYVTHHVQIIMHGLKWLVPQLAAGLQPRDRAMRHAIFPGRKFTFQTSSANSNFPF
jgi:hypothetical protein